VPNNISGDFSVKLKFDGSAFEVKAPETKFTVAK
jgi:hypothetical protein